MKKKDKHYPLRYFYLITTLVLGILFSLFYIFSGAAEGYVLAIFLEFILGALVAIPITLVYLFFIYRKK